MDPSQSYMYNRKRRSFGRQIIFANHNEVLFSEPSHHEYMRNYILQNPVHRSTQLSTQMSCHEVNTWNVPHFPQGVSHTEGGWPKDVNFHDDEQTFRYRKKIQREDNWAQQIMQLTKPVLHAVRQNSAVNIYQDYFKEINPSEPKLNYSAKVTNIYADPNHSNCAVLNLSWSPQNKNRLLGTYGFKNYFLDDNIPCESHIWNIENSNKPISTLVTPGSVSCIEWNNRDDHMIAGGFRSGKVGIWDPRVDISPNSVSVVETSHREPVTSLRWIQSKTNTEFFTSATDGSIFWWDARKLTEPSNILLLQQNQSVEEPNFEKTQGCTILEYDYNIPARFMVGTDYGYVFVANRKAAAQGDMIVMEFPVMAGPIYSLERHPAYFKNFLVVGDFCAKIWTDECRDSELFRTYDHTSLLTCGTWSQTRSSLFFLGRNDGVLELWDLLMEYNKPMFTLNVANSGISSIKSSETGKFVLVGTEDGDIIMVKLDEGLFSSDKNDKNLMAAAFERETHRGKLLEGRIRELKLKLEVTSSHKIQDADIDTEQPIRLQESNTEANEEILNDDEWEKTERYFFEIIHSEENRRKSRTYNETKTIFDENDSALLLQAGVGESESQIIIDETGNLNENNAKQEAKGL